MAVSGNVAYGSNTKHLNDVNITCGDGEIQEDSGHEI